jgi:sulfite reductase (NADPH) flavoprotein alpha-component
VFKEGMTWNTPSLTILFATETGNAAALAEFAEATARHLGVSTRAVDAATYNTTQLPLEREVLIITSTHEGNPPYSAVDFFDVLDDATPPLPSLRFAVLALGDSAYDDFCAAGQRIDRSLEARGACRLVPRCDIDVGERAVAQDWIRGVLARVAATYEVEAALRRRSGIRPARIVGPV